MNHENLFKKKHIVTTKPAIIPTPDFKFVFKPQKPKIVPPAKKMLDVQFKKSITSDLTYKAKPGAGQQLIARQEPSSIVMQCVQEKKEPKYKQLIKFLQLAGKQPKIYTPQEMEELLKAGKYKQDNIIKVQTIDELPKAGKIKQLPGKNKQANINNVQNIEKVKEAGKITKLPGKTINELPKAGKITKLPGKTIDELLKAGKITQLPGKIKQANVNNVQKIDLLLKAGKITQLPGKIKQANVNNVQNIEKEMEADNMQENIKLLNLMMTRKTGRNFVVSKKR